jgi:hypothetical protein
VRDVVLAILAQVLAIRIDYRGSVVVDTRDLFFVDGDDNYHAVFLGDFLHQAHSRTIGNLFDCLVPASLLLSTKVGSGKNFLHAENLDALFRGLLDKTHVLFDVQSFDFINRHIGSSSVGTLDKSAFDGAWHMLTSSG